MSLVSLKRLKNKKQNTLLTFESIHSCKLWRKCICFFVFVVNRAAEKLLWQSCDHAWCTLKPIAPSLPPCALVWSFISFHVMHMSACKVCPKGVYSARKTTGPHGTIHQVYMKIHVGWVRITQRVCKTPQACLPWNPELGRCCRLWKRTWAPTDLHDNDSFVLLVQ